MAARRVILKMVTIFLLVLHRLGLARRSPFARQTPPSSPITKMYELVRLSQAVLLRALSGHLALAQTYVKLKNLI
jgi:hypothetical protein